LVVKTVLVANFYCQKYMMPLQSELTYTHFAFITVVYCYSIRTRLHVTISKLDNESLCCSAMCIFPIRLSKKINKKSMIAAACGLIEEMLNITTRLLNAIEVVAAVVCCYKPL